jgi:hypothetical protein
MLIEQEITWNGWVYLADTIDKTNGFATGAAHRE